MPTRMPISLRDRGVEADLPLYLSFAPQEVPAHRLARPLGVARLHPPEDRGHRAGAHRRCGRLIRSSYNSQLSITVALWLVKRRRRGAETGRGGNRPAADAAPALLHRGPDPTRVRRGLHRAPDRRTRDAAGPQSAPGPGAASHRRSPRWSVEGRRQANPPGTRATTSTAPRRVRATTERLSTSSSGERPR